MGVETHQAVAIACVPSAIPAVERASHFALARELFHELAQERTQLPDGYAFRFEPDAFEAVARFVANERKCCPFMNVELSLARESGPVWLRMTGPAGTREVVQAELGLPGSCTCDYRRCPMDDPSAAVPQVTARSDVGRSTDSTTRTAKWTAVGGVFAALGVFASCCLLPFTLAALGVGGAWLGGFVALARYKPIFVTIAVALLAYGFYAVYWKPRKACAAGAACTTCRPGRSVRVGLWGATVLAASSVLFDYLEPYLLGV